MLRLGSIVIGVDDVDRGVAFWSAALGYEVIPLRDDGDGFTILRHPSGQGTRVAIHRSDAAPTGRLHVDLIVESPRDQASEIERLLALGASRPEWTYPADPDFVVLADPAGNPFCVVDASHG